MIGVSLSKWTMSYFAAALLALLGAEVLMVTGFGFPSHGTAAPETLLLVHLVAVGWLSLLMCGALIQFVPVLVAKPLVHPELPAAALALLIAGLACLLAGFLRMAGFSILARVRRPAPHQHPGRSSLRKRIGFPTPVGINNSRLLNIPPPVI